MPDPKILTATRKTFTVELYRRDDGSIAAHVLRDGKPELIAIGSARRLVPTAVRDAFARLVQRDGEKAVLP